MLLVGLTFPARIRQLTRQASLSERFVRVLSRSRGAMRSVVGLVGSATLALSLVFFVSPAQADPDQPTTVAEAQTLVNKLNDEAAVIDQDYADAQARMATSQKKLDQDNADVSAQEAKVAGMRSQVAQIALANFQQKDAGTTIAFLSSKQDAFFSKLSTMQKVSSNQLTVLQSFQAGQANLTDMKVAAETEVANQTKAKADMVAAKSKSDGKIAEAKAALAGLTEAERKKIAEQEAAAKAADEARAAPAARSNRSTERPTGQTTTNKTPKSESQPPTATGSASSRATRAVAFARAQVGKPYQADANRFGPNHYDCSGLTWSAWHAAGVNIPTVSYTQWNAGRPVAKSDLQPGDLVFFYNLGHVGLYIGGGQVVHAANPRSGVNIAPLNSMPFDGARRVG